jgi:hypothetical protein
MSLLWRREPDLERARRGLILLIDDSVAAGRSQGRYPPPAALTAAAQFVLTRDVALLAEASPAAARTLALRREIDAFAVGALLPPADVDLYLQLALATVEAWAGPSRRVRAEVAAAGQAFHRQRARLLMAADDAAGAAALRAALAYARLPGAPSAALALALTELGEWETRAGAAAGTARLEETLAVVAALPMDALGLAEAQMTATRARRRLGLAGPGDAPGSRVAAPVLASPIVAAPPGAALDPISA